MIPWGSDINIGVLYCSVDSRYSNLLKAWKISLYGQYDYDKHVHQNFWDDGIESKLITALIFEQTSVVWKEPVTGRVEVRSHYHHCHTTSLHSSLLATAFRNFSRLRLRTSEAPSPLPRSSASRTTVSSRLSETVYSVFKSQSGHRFNFCYRKFETYEITIIWHDSGQI